MKWKSHIRKIIKMGGLTKGTLKIKISSSHRMQELQRLSAICLCDIVCILSSVSPAPERRVVLFDFDFRCHWETWTSALYHRTKKCVRKLGNERAGRASLFIIYIHVQTEFLKLRAGKNVVKPIMSSLCNRKIITVIFFPDSSCPWVFVTKKINTKSLKLNVW